MERHRKIAIIVTGEDGIETQAEYQAERVQIGRNAAMDFVLNSESVSRRHCCLEWRPEGLFVVDLNSSSGVYLNGNRIGREAKLTNGSELQIGQRLVRIDLVDD